MSLIKIWLYNLLMDSNQFSGTIPADIGSLTALRTTAVSMNQLSGILCTDSCYILKPLMPLISVGFIPAELAHLTNSIKLMLNDNWLRSTLPSVLGHNALSHLDLLSLNDNDISGTIPSSYGELQSLVNTSGSKHYAQARLA